MSFCGVGDWSFVTNAIGLNSKSIKFELNYAPLAIYSHLSCRLYEIVHCSIALQWHIAQQSTITARRSPDCAQQSWDCAWNGHYLGKLSSAINTMVRMIAQNDLMWIFRVRQTDDGHRQWKCRSAMGFVSNRRQCHHSGVPLIQLSPAVHST